MLSLDIAESQTAELHKLNDSACTKFNDNVLRARQYLWSNGTLQLITETSKIASTVRFDECVIIIIIVAIWECCLSNEMISRLIFVDGDFRAVCLHCAEVVQPADSTAFALVSHRCHASSGLESRQD